MNENLIYQLKDLLDIRIVKKNTNNNLLLVDRGSIDPVIRSSLIAQIFNETQNLNIIVLSIYKKTSWRHEVYKSFGIGSFILSPRLKNFILHPYLFLKSSFIFLIKYSQFCTKDFRWLIENLKVSNIHIGDLIYDSYLRYNLKFLKPKKFDFRLIYLFILAVYKTIFIENILEKNKVNQVIVSTATYINDSSITLRLATKKNIPSLFVFWFLLIFHNNYERSLLSRRKIFKRDIDNLQLPNNWIDEFEKYATSRYSGRIEYQDFLNAYKNKVNLTKKDLFNQMGIGIEEYSHIVLIAPHAFSDASHESFDMIFDNYYEHFVETLEHVKKNKNLNDTLWIVNPHPSSHVFKEEGIAKSFVDSLNCKNIILFPKHINVFSALRSADTIITCRGTIGLEFPACFGKKSIIAGEAPYSGFGFIEEPKNKEEYFKCLDNIKSISLMTDEEKQLAKKVFYFYECLQLNSCETTILPTNRFLSPDAFVNTILEKLNSKKFKEDEYYCNARKSILNNIKND